MKFFTDQAKEEANAARDALVIDAIVEWARSLPVGVAEVDVAGDVVAVRPRNPRAADFEIFPEYDTVFNFLLAGEQMYPRLDRAFAILLLEALAQGRCQRTLWERRGKGAKFSIATAEMCHGSGYLVNLLDSFVTRRTDLSHDSHQ